MFSRPKITYTRSSDKPFPGSLIVRVNDERSISKPISNQVELETQINEHLKLNENDQACVFSTANIQKDILGTFQMGTYTTKEIAESICQIMVEIAISTNSMTTIAIKQNQQKYVIWCQTTEALTCDELKKRVNFEAIANEVEEKVKAKENLMEIKNLITTSKQRTKSTKFINKQIDMYLLAAPEKQTKDLYDLINKSIRDHLKTKRETGLFNTESRKSSAGIFSQPFNFRNPDSLDLYTKIRKLADCDSDEIASEFEFVIDDKRDNGNSKSNNNSNNNNKSTSSSNNNNVAFIRGLGR